MTSGPAPAEERVAVLDAEGRVVRVATRTEVRRLNLPHAAVVVLLRDSAGRIYVQRRSPDKDWAPSHYDVGAGGVLHVDEDVHDAALRELAEELGVTGVPLAPLPGVVHEDDTVRCRLHAYEATYDGPVRHADGEVVWGRWMTLAGLRDQLARTDWPFVPDTRTLLTALARAGVHDYAELLVPRPEH